VDEWGEPYPEHVLNDLLRSAQAVLFKDDLLSSAGTSLFEQAAVEAIDKALGDAQPFKLRRSGKRGDATILVKSAGDCFEFLVNREKQMVAVAVQISLQAGDYEIFACDEDAWCSGTPDGAQVLSARQLGRFRRAWALSNLVSRTFAGRIRRLADPVLAGIG